MYMYRDDSDFSIDIGRLRNREGSELIFRGPVGLNGAACQCAIQFALDRGGSRKPSYINRDRRDRLKLSARVTDSRTPA